MEKKRIITAFLLVITLVLGFAPVKEVQAAEGISNLKLDSNGILTWDAYSGASFYRITFPGNYTSDTTETTFDAKRFIMGYGWSSGSYKIKIAAFRSNAVQLSETTETTYNYTSKGKLEEPTIIKWNGFEAEWWPVSNVDIYEYLVYDETDNLIIRNDTTVKTQVDLSDLFMLKSHEYSFQVTAKSYYGYENSFSYKVSNGWYYDGIRNYVRFCTNWGEEDVYVYWTNNDTCKLEDSPKVERPSYKLLGWYNRREGGQKIDLDKVFAANTELYAHWEELSEINISFDSGGGSGSMSPVSWTVGTNWTVPECSFTSSDTDKEFDCWKTSDDKNVKSGDTIEQSCRTRGKRTEVYFAHPYCSSERATNENHNRMIRRWIPKGDDIGLYSPREVKEIV